MESFTLHDSFQYVLRLLPLLLFSFTIHAQSILPERLKNLIDQLFHTTGEAGLRSIFESARNIPFSEERFFLDTWNFSIQLYARIMSTTYIQNTNNMANIYRHANLMNQQTILDVLDSAPVSWREVVQPLRHILLTQEPLSHYMFEIEAGFRPSQEATLYLQSNLPERNPRTQEIILYFIWRWARDNATTLQNWSQNFLQSLSNSSNIRLQIHGFLALGEFNTHMQNINYYRQALNLAQQHRIYDLPQRARIALQRMTQLPGPIPLVARAHLALYFQGSSF